MCMRLVGAHTPRHSAPSCTHSITHLMCPCSHRCAPTHPAPSCGLYCHTASTTTQHHPGPMPCHSASVISTLSCTRPLRTKRLHAASLSSACAEETADTDAGSQRSPLQFRSSPRPTQGQQGRRRRPRSASLLHPLPRPARSNQPAEHRSTALNPQPGQPSTQHTWPGSAKKPG